MTSPHNEIDTLRASLGAITTPAMFRMGLRDAIIERVFDDIDPSEDTANPEVDWLTAEQCADQVLDAIHAHYAGRIAPNEWAEANADLTLWCVHVLGPDDIRATASHADAVHDAAILNGRMAQYSAGQPNDVLCFAYPDIWPGDAASHSAALKAQAQETTDAR